MVNLNKNMEVNMYLLVIYLLMCVIVAGLGRNTLFGPFVYFFVALLITPVLAAFLLLLTLRRKKTKGSV